MTYITYLFGFPVGSFPIRTVVSWLLFHGLDIAAPRERREGEPPAIDDPFRHPSRLMENDPKFYEKNTPVVEAVAAGEIELGLVNHYYLSLVKEENPDAAVANHFLTGRDPGALVSVAGVAILETADNADAARQFVEFLLSEPSQRFYVDEAEEAEYPLVAGIDAKPGLPPLASLQGPQIELEGPRMPGFNVSDVIDALLAGNYDDPEQWRTPVAVVERVVLPSFA